MMGRGTRRRPACLLNILLELLHVTLELSPPVLKPANNLKKDKVKFLFFLIFLAKFVFV